MATDHIRYDLLAQDALRSVMRKVLADAAKKGLPGEHHFYISFNTGAEGVRMSARLREQYPEEITIILQHQFWDLVVHDDHFEVGLSFGGVPERLSVPFAAIKGFFDPSVQFGLQFESIEEQDTAAPPAVRAAPEAETGPKPKPQVAAVPALGKPGDLKRAESEPAPEQPAAGAEVVRLDRFRKK
jgi:hypothetical protein